MTWRLPFRIKPSAASLTVWIGLCTLCAALGLAASLCIAAMVRLAGAPL